MPFFVTHENPSPSRFCNLETVNAGTLIFFRLKLPKMFSYYVKVKYKSTNNTNIMTFFKFISLLSLVIQKSKKWRKETNARM